MIKTFKNEKILARNLALKILKQLKKRGLFFDAHSLAREFESDNPQISLPYIRERQIWGQKIYPELN